MNEMGKPRLIRAAGGLLWREKEGRREILIIHRSRYDDWSLPKGKVKDGECLDETALREVAEETGYRAELLDFAGDVFYYAGESPKIVLFWNMRVMAEIPAVERASDSPDEGDEIRWLPVAAALEIISYEEERGLLRQAAQGRHPGGFTPGEAMPHLSTRKEAFTMAESVTAFEAITLVQPSKWYQHPFENPSAGRLRTALESYYQEMRHLEAMVIAAGLEGLDKSFQALARLLCETKEALDHGDVEYGWRAFNTAQCIETLIYSKMRCLGQDVTLQDYATSLYIGRAEGLYVEGQNKLSGWRLLRIQNLLGDEKKKFKGDPIVGDVVQAQRTLSEHFENTYLRLKIINNQIRFLESIAILALVVWLMLLLLVRQFSPDSFDTPTPFSLSVLAVIFGVLGACISGILRLEKRSVNKRIPGQLESRAFMLARPLIGAVSALGVVYFVLAGIVTFGEQTAWLYIATAFAAGFSERLLKFSVDQVGSEGDAEKKE